MDVPDYDFRSLSPIDFEVLVRDLLNAELKLKLTTFAVGSDGGVDLRDIDEGVVTVVQCKHRPDIKKRELVRTATAEAKRWQTRRREIAAYHFVVSASITPGAIDATVEALSPLPVVANRVWHRGALNSTLARHAEVERDHFKLWLASTEVLDRIANAAQWQRSEALITQVAERVRLYVHTPAYEEAMRLLEREHVLIISGAPGVGKSTLAEMILLAMWEQGWTVVNIASDIGEAWNKVRGAGEKEKVVFYYDDFLGQTNLVEVQKNEAGGIAHLLDTISRSNGDLRLVVTTREQILNQAQAGPDDRLRRLLPDTAKFRVALDEIGRGARARMLFNHIHFGFDERRVRRGLARDTRYLKVIDHRGFNPRVLESVALRQAHSSVDEFYDALLHALDHPGEVWAGSFLQLSSTAMDILFHLATTSTTSVGLESLRSTVSAADPRDWEIALKVLEGTWIRLVADRDVVNRVVLFDPSRRDYLLDLLDDPAYFAYARARVRRIGQYHYLMLLAGVVSPANDWRGGNRRPRLARNFGPIMPSLDTEVTTLARTEWLRTEVDLNRVVAKHAAEGAGGGRFRNRDLTVMGERAELLAQTADICFRSTSAMPLLSGWLHEALDSGGAVASAETYLTAANALQLVAALVHDDAPDWAVEHGASLVTEALEGIGGTDEIRSFGALPDAFRNRLDQDLVYSELIRAFESELEEIAMETDPDSAKSWLDDVISLAWHHDVQLDTHELEDRVARMPRAERRASVEPSALHDAVGEADASDKALAELFAKLA